MESRLKERAKLDYLKSAVRALGGGCNVTEQALIKGTGKVQLFKYPEEELHSLPDQSVSFTAHSLPDKAHLS